MAPSFKQRAVERFQKERTDAISEMFNNVGDDGIYPTTKFFNRLDAVFSLLLDEQLAEVRAKIEGKVKKWSLDNHHCLGWAEKDDEGCTKTHGYCGCELEHGIEIEELRDELSDTLEALK